ncbi:MAG TPA: SWIM zinc finger family protein [Humisphaera sp.]|nr:SWIM zinc finger family protein [Humisphaera sp.]
MGFYYGFKPYVSVAKRQANAAKQMAKLAKKGRTITPIKISGNKIATTFWGKAWCDNLEDYSDYSNRLPRGRTYVRNGSVVDLQIEAGRVKAIVSGSSLYNVDVKINTLHGDAWSRLKRECGGKIGSLVELLQGRLSQGVMELVTNASGGLFPKPAEIEMDCSCPDGAYMCKHIAAVLYGVGAMLDQRPELLFALRKVDHLELIAEATVPTITGSDASRQTIAAGDLADVFGIEMEATDVPAIATPAAAPVPAPKRARGARKAIPEVKKARKAKSRVAAETPVEVERTKKSKRVMPSIAAVVKARKKRVGGPA